MSKSEGSPTMIIPAGTEISIDAHGQLSVRTPGNLVIQNSGHYGEIESLHGSIRIEANAEVEAVSVRCAETCYVQGSLTSWRVKAKNINLEEKAQARVVLQESESIEIGKNAKLVGNFSSEKELFLLFSRFAPQLRSLPFYFDRNSSPHLEFEENAPDGPVLEAKPAAPGGRAAHCRAAHYPAAHCRIGCSSRSRSCPTRFSSPWCCSSAKAKTTAHGPSVRVIDELVKLLKARDLETLKHTHRTLFSRVTDRERRHPAGPRADRAIFRQRPQPKSRPRSDPRPSGVRPSLRFGLFHHGTPPERGSPRARRQNAGRRAGSKKRARLGQDPVRASAC